MSKGKIAQPIHKIYTLEESPSAIKDLMDRKVIGKAVVQVREEPIFEKTQVTEAPKMVNKSSNETEAIQKISINGIADIKNHIGKIAGPTKWLRVTQKMINEFAAATLDFQWVHIDTEKAKQFLPGGKTIAHGYLTMSLASHFFYDIISIENVTTFFNYGINKARFISPVPVDSEIRLIAKLNSVEEQSNGSVKLFLGCTIELKGAEKPAYVAELISVIF
jgi:acyl dehydratase